MQGAPEWTEALRAYKTNHMSNPGGEQRERERERETRRRDERETRERESL
jgi:hypothetical protein